MGKIVLIVQGDLHIHLGADISAITSRLDNIMDKTQLAAALNEITAQNEKAKAEILAKIAALEAAVAEAGNTTPAIDEALAALKVSVQGSDDIGDPTV